LPAEQDFAADRDFGERIAAEQSTGINDLRIRFALWQHENPFRQNGPALRISRDAPTSRMRR
jgi:hypothetical protein